MAMVDIVPTRPIIVVAVIGENMIATLILTAQATWNVRDLLPDQWMAAVIPMSFGIIIIALIVTRIHTAHPITATHGIMNVLEHRL